MGTLGTGDTGPAQGGDSIGTLGSRGTGHGRAPGTGGARAGTELGRGVHGLTSVPWPSSCHQRGHQYFLRAGALTQGAGGVAEASQLALLPVPLALQQLLHRVSAQQVLGQHRADVERAARTAPTSRKAQRRSKDGMAAGAGVLMGWHSHKGGALARTAQPQAWGTSGDGTATRTGQRQGQHNHEDGTPLGMARSRGCGTGGDSTARGMGHRWGWPSCRTRRRGWCVASRGAVRWQWDGVW